VKKVSINPLPVHMFRCSLILSALLLLNTVVLWAPGASAEQTLKIPTDLNYEVWMDDKPLGTHSFGFSEDASGSLLQVDSKAVFNVKVLFVNVFSYDHSATELWNGHCLSSLSSNTTTNGKEEAIELRFEDDSCAGTYSYWDSTRLNRPVLTNAQNGEQEDASWQQLATTALPKPSKKVKLAKVPEVIEHFQLETPSANFLLWYDAQGRNLVMQTTNDGRTITYINRELL